MLVSCKSSLNVPGHNVTIYFNKIIDFYIRFKLINRKLKSFQIHNMEVYFLYRGNAFHTVIFAILCVKLALQCFVEKIT